MDIERISEAMGVVTEADIRRYATRLYETATGTTPRLFDRKWWTGRLLEWAIRDEAFKVQLFRFIDVLPTLKTPSQIKRLTEEYFGQDAALRDAPGGRPLMRWGMRALSSVGFGAGVTADTIYNQAIQMANQFIVGAGMKEALPAITDLWKRGIAHSVDLLGEATVCEPEAETYAARYHEAITALAEAAREWRPSPLLEADHLGPLPRTQVSIKLSALDSQFDPIDPESCYTAVAARLRPLLRAAMQHGVAVTFDMEHYEWKDLTLWIVKRLLMEDEFRAFPFASLALQAYLKDTICDARELLVWAEARRTPIGIRLVKGAYWDYETIMHRQRGWPVPVFARKDDTDASYERLVPFLLEHRAALRPAFGSHNLRHVAMVMAEAERRGLATNVVELQMLYGMAEPLQAAVVDAGYRLRVYAPVGDLIPGMAYLVRRLLENTANESILRRQFLGNQSLDELLKPPNVEDVPLSPTLSSTRCYEEATFSNEPHTDFSRAEARERMRTALASVRATLGRRIELAFPPPRGRTRPTLTARNPARPEQVVGVVSAAVQEDVDEAVSRAVAGGRSWAAMPASDRMAVLAKAADVLRRRRFELAALEVFEVGKGWRDADADVAEAIDFLEYYRHQMRRLAEPIRLGTLPGEVNHLVYRPRGTVAVLSPWNFPLAIPTGMVAAALVTGNAVVFKPSERSPVTGHALVEVFREAGLPDGVLQFLPGEPEAGRRLVAHPDVPVIAFTGSQAVGLQIIADAARVLPGQREVKKVVAEMGGKNAIIVDDTADLDEAVAGVIASSLGYQGQKCSACSRAIVLDAIHDPFVSRLMEAARSVRMGPPEEPGTRLGPLIDQRAVQKVRDYLAIAKEEGTPVLLPDLARGPGPNFVGPAIVTNIRPEHRLANEEIFGTVLAVLRARDFDEALTFANATESALTGGLFSRSPRNITRAREEFRVGNLYINRDITGALVGRQPFGGARLSGTGAKAGGPDYLLQFVSGFVLSENTLRRGFSPELS
jgi:RHH-type proline utilization regulon transcriptional repressor/proline dehydrogenase/delta 1-pyrroline-5-carboxylate dehydrogenase